MVDMSDHKLIIFDEFLNPRGLALSLQRAVDHTTLLPKTCDMKVANRHFPPLFPLDSESIAGPSACIGM